MVAGYISSACLWGKAGNNIGRDERILIIRVDGRISTGILRLSLAGVAQLVEHHLAKVDVESSSLFARSI
jgi:hypothetical protein